MKCFYEILNIHFFFCLLSNLRQQTKVNWNLIIYSNWIEDMKICELSSSFLVHNPPFFSLFFPVALHMHKHMNTYVCVIHAPLSLSLSLSIYLSIYIYIYLRRIPYPAHVFALPISNTLLFLIIYIYIYSYRNTSIIAPVQCWWRTGRKWNLYIRNWHSSMTSDEEP